MTWPWYNSPHKTESNTDLLTDLARWTHCSNLALAQAKQGQRINTAYIYIYMKPKADLSLPPLWLVMGCMCICTQAGRGGEAASTLHLLSAYEKKRKKEACTCAAHARHAWHSVSDECTTGLSVHSHSAPAARCQIYCGLGVQTTAQRPTWVRLSSLSCVSGGRGVGGAYWKLLASTKTTAQQRLSKVAWYTSPSGQ